MASEAGERLHPLSLLFGIGTAAKNLLVPAIAVLLFSPADRGSAWFAILFFPVVFGSVLHYLSFRYYLGPDEMVIRKGILRRNERHIPYARIQNIDLVQNLFHRLFDVAVVKLETASGGKPEAVISVLTLPTIERMRERVFADRDRAGPEAEAAGAGGRVLVTTSLADLVIFGTLSRRGLVMVAAALGVASQTGVFRDPMLYTGPLEDPSWLPRLTLPSSFLWVGALAVAGILAAIAALWLLSVLWAVLKFYGFRLERQGEDLRAHYGLLTRVTATIPRRRIQLLSLRRSPLHRWFDRVSVQVDTAGGGGGDGNEPGNVAERQWLAPIVARDRLETLLAEVLPMVDPREIRWRPIAERAWGRLFRRWLAMILLATAVGFVPFGPFILPLPVVAIPLALLCARLYVRCTAWALTSTAVLYRSGIFGRSLSIVPFAKIQVVSTRQTPFDRRAGMARVHVDTAGANPRGHQVQVDYLELDDARELHRRLDREAGRTAFRW